MKRNKILILIVAIILLIFIIYNIFFVKPIVLNIKYEQNKLNNNELIMNVYVDSHFLKFNRDIWCNISYDNNIDETNWKKASNGYCSYSVSNTDFKLYVKDKYGNVTNVNKKLYDIDKVINIKFERDIIYMYKGMTKELFYTINTIGTPDTKLTLNSSNSNVIDIFDNTIEAIDYGNAYITAKSADGFEKRIEVVVNKHISKPTIRDNKQYVDCNQFSKEEADTLDNILFSRIEEAGNTTRAGVVAAARFLTLEFNYRIPYFYENGRLNNYAPYLFVDGEGRYYHKGLYLNASKFSNIKASFVGPAIWGCDLQNYTNWGPYVSGKFYPNGLDCSGFVTWALLNGGFDVGDIGAGTDKEHFDLTDIGEKVLITDDLMSSGRVKVGDLIGLNGHMAILAGMDEDNYYIAESLNTTRGVVMTVVKRNKLVNNSIYKYIILMDNFYKNDGNLSNMW